MAIRALKTYADTSIFGGAFDDRFKDATGRFLEAVGRGEFILVVSEIVRAEIASAPPPVVELYRQLVSDALTVEVTEEALALRDAYQAAGILGPRWKTDALHVAIASVSECDIIASWNFSHIVHFDKIPRYNAVNALGGFRPVRIHSPWELVGNENTR
jgi:predicted nucleic acid-binding protein